MGQVEQSPDARSFHLAQRGERLRWSGSGPLMLRIRLSPELPKPIKPRRTVTAQFLRALRTQATISTCLYPVPSGWRRVIASAHSCATRAMSWCSRPPWPGRLTRW